MNTLRRFALLAAMSLAVGCASVPLIIQIAGYVVSAMDVALSAAQTFTEANVTDPGKRTEILTDISRARAAESAFEALVNGGAALDSKDVTAALADFAVAWNDVEALLKDLGVVTASPSARPALGELSGRLVLPTADDLMPKGADVAGIHVRAAAVRAARQRASETALRSPGVGKPAEPSPGHKVTVFVSDGCPSGTVSDGIVYTTDPPMLDCYPVKK